MISLLSNSASVELLHKQVVREHFQEFIKSTNFKSISSYLFQKELISSKDFETLSNSTDKGNVFYIQILPTKGSGVYTMLRRCIAEETEHRGHVKLNKLFEEAEQRAGIRLPFDQ